ncbi:hypothetical protein TH66_11240 [Carbonactinospora thermoautotrophica]|uniref:Uncharacterized protein n=1 Tax=Carbonactinospora thermoautotrophica TaxID=1469144 RepID=A0A132N0M3_9ACTN|nr:hypothetical protein TH66_11240 [Carbonactinospora thermoautotrophica]KWX09764.1 hypothetical protein TR74_07655 [Carbonactinospora thermoautotrophica]
MYRVEYTAQAKAARASLRGTASVRRAGVTHEDGSHECGPLCRRRYAQQGRVVRRGYGLVFYFDDMQGLITIRDIVWGK